MENSSSEEFENLANNRVWKLVSATVLLSVIVVSLVYLLMVNSQSMISKDVQVHQTGPIKVVAKKCRRVADSGGAVATDGIAIVADDKTQIGPLTFRLFYDHDNNGKFNSSVDGVILVVEDESKSLSSEALFYEGIIHSGPGIGPVRIESELVAVNSENEKNTVRIAADLTTVFNVK